MYHPIYTNDNDNGIDILNNKPASIVLDLLAVNLMVAGDLNATLKEDFMIILYMMTLTSCMALIPTTRMIPLLHHELIKTNAATRLDILLYTYVVHTVFIC